MRTVAIATTIVLVAISSDFIPRQPELPGDKVHFPGDKVPVSLPIALFGTFRRDINGFSNRFQPFPSVIKNLIPIQAREKEDKDV